MNRRKFLTLFGVSATTSAYVLSALDANPEGKAINKIRNHGLHAYQLPAHRHDVRLIEKVYCDGYEHTHIPIGTRMYYSGTEIPEGFIVCDKNETLVKGE